MARTIHKTDNVTLEGFQAVLEPSKFGYSLGAVVGNDVIEMLETERAEVLKWAESKLKNPKRSTRSQNLGKKYQRVSIKLNSLGMKRRDHLW